MHRISAAIVLLIAIAASAPADEPPPPLPMHEQAIDLAPLAAWGTQRYVYELQDRDGTWTPLGHVTFATRHDDNTVALDDSWQLTYRGKAMTWRGQITCRPDSVLSPRHIDSIGTGDDDEAKTFTATFADDGTATIESADTPRRTMTLPPGTLTDAALYRVCTLLPRKAGTTWRIDDWLEVSELNHKQTYTLTCEGLAPEDTADPTPCTRYIHRQRGRAVAELLVSEAGHLERVIIDGRKRLRRVTADTP